MKKSSFDVRSIWCHTVLFLLAAAGSTPANAQSRARDGATAGGVAGAIIGGIIGHQNDETPEGALIGGAVGALAGGLIGKSQDAELERQRYYQQQAYYQQQQQLYAQQQAVTNSGVGVHDVVSMTRSGLSESLIISQLQAKGVQRRLEVSEIIALHQQGVSDTVISAMQQAPLATQLAGSAQTSGPLPQLVAPQPVIRQSSVIVHEPVIYARPPVYMEHVYYPYPSFYHHHHHHRAYHQGTSIRIGF